MSKPKTVMVTLQIQKEVTPKELTQYIRTLERDGWCVDVQSEEEEE